MNVTQIIILIITIITIGGVLGGIITYLIMKKTGRWDRLKQKHEARIHTENRSTDEFRAFRFKNKREKEVKHV